MLLSVSPCITLLWFSMIFCTLHCKLCARAIALFSLSTVNSALPPPSSITQRASTTTAVSVSWSQVSSATGYYVSYQRRDLGAPPVVTPQYERIVGGATTSVTLSGLEPGTTYRIRVWSTNGTSVSSRKMETDVTTMESGEKSLEHVYIYAQRSFIHFMAEVELVCSLISPFFRDIFLNALYFSFLIIHHHSISS